MQLFNSDFYDKNQLFGKIELTEIPIINVIMSRGEDI